MDPLTPGQKIVASLFKNSIPEVPRAWITLAKSASQARQMLMTWESCQLALVELPPEKRDQAWALRHAFAANSYTHLLQEGVPIEPDLEGFISAVALLYGPTDKSRFPPFGGILPLVLDETFCADVRITMDQLKETMAHHGRLEACKPVGRVLSRIHSLDAEIDRYIVMEAILEGILASRGYGGQLGRPE